MKLLTIFEASDPCLGAIVDLENSQCPPSPDDLFPFPASSDGPEI